MPPGLAEALASDHVAKAAFDSLSHTHGGDASTTAREAIEMLRAGVRTLG